MGYSYEPKRTAPPLHPPKPKVQTLHVYVGEDEEDDDEAQLPLPPSSKDWGTRCMAVLAVIMLAVFIFVPYQAVYATSFISVPAQFLPPKVFTVSEKMTPTGTQTIPATTASGVLTLYNGSLFSQGIPQGFQVTSSSGVTISTDQAVTIPAANPPSEGMATVTAHAVSPGAVGNIAAGAVNQTESGYILIKNLTGFSGGQDAVTTKVVTPDDVATALAAARGQLVNQRPTTMLARPCDETQNQQQTTLMVSWSCVYAMYTAPTSAQILSAFVEGDQVILEIKTLVTNSGG